MNTPITHERLIELEFKRYNFYKKECFYFPIVDDTLDFICLNFSIANEWWIYSTIIGDELTPIRKVDTMEQVNCFVNGIIC